MNLKNGGSKSCGCLSKYNKLSDETLPAKHVLFISYKKGAKKRGFLIWIKKCYTHLKSKGF